MIAFCMYFKVRPAELVDGLDMESRMTPRFLA